MSTRRGWWVGAAVLDCCTFRKMLFRICEQTNGEKWPLKLQMNRLRFKTSEKSYRTGSEESREYNSNLLQKKTERCEHGIGWTWKKTTRISTDYAKNPSRNHLFVSHHLLPTQQRYCHCVCLTNWKAYLNALSTHIPYRHTVHSTVGRC